MTHILKDKENEVNELTKELKEKSKILEINTKLIIGLQTPQISLGDKTDRFGREILLDKTNDTIKNPTPKSTGKLQLKSHKLVLNNYCLNNDLNNLNPQYSHIVYYFLLFFTISGWLPLYMS